MRIEEDPRLPRVSTGVMEWASALLRALTAYLGRMARQLNLLTEGRIEAVTNAGTAAPTTGTHFAGDFVRNASPTEQTAVPGENYVVAGWICTVSGTPGTWEELRQLTGSTTAGWEDELSDIGPGRGVGANTPTWTVFRDGIYGYAFHATLMNEVWINFHVPHNWKAGTKWYPHIHWACATAPTAGQKVHFGIEYTFCKGHNQAAFPASATITLEPTVSATQYQHMITECSDVQAILPTEVDSLILMRIYRDPAQAADNCAQLVYIFFVDCHYQVDRANGTLNKAPNFYA